MILHALRKLVLFCPDDWDVANCEPGRGFVKEGVLSPQRRSGAKFIKVKMVGTSQVVYARAGVPNPCDGPLSLPL